MSRLTSLLSIKPGEGRVASLTIGVMLFTAMGAALGGTGIEALFFARFGVEYLPYMFLGLGVTSMLTSFLITAALGRIPRQILYITIPLLIALLLVGVRFALLTKLIWLYPVLWLGKEILNSLITLVIWGVAGVVYDTRQAKRLFPLFNASRILGQVIGGFATGALVGIIGTENLLLVWAGALLLAFVFSRALLAGWQITSAPERKARRKQPTLVQEMQRGFQYIRGSSLMTWIAISTIFFSILYFSISLPFSRAATEQYINEDSLASFLGLFNGLSTGAAFLVSLFLANRLFARFGIMLCILAFPIIYLIGFGGLILAPIFIIIVAFRFVQMLWLSGIADPAWQTMLNVVPPEKRDQVRAFIGGVPEQAGTFIAGGILIIGEQTLTPQQLYFIGLFAAACCTYIVYQARQGYNNALIEALRAGRPNLFYTEEQPFGGFHQDSVAVQTALKGLRDSNRIVRRVSAEILGHLSLPESTNALINGLSDADSLVRAACLRALSHSKATPALLDIAASLSDPEPDVRFEAVSALSALAASSRGLTTYLTPMLNDEDTRVSTRAAVSLLKSPSHTRAERTLNDPEHSRRGDEVVVEARGEDSVFSKAKFHLRNTAVLGDLEERLHAIAALGEWSDKEAFDFLANELRERSLESGIKSAILTSLTQINSQDSVLFLLDALKDKDARETSARLFGKMGAPVMESVLAALEVESSVDGALLALQYLPPPPAKQIVDFARTSVSRAGEYDALMRGVSSNSRAERSDPELVEGKRSRSEALHLLGESLHNKSHQHGIRALRAIGLLGDRVAMNTAIENLQTRDTSQRANVIEALESISARWRDILQPLMQLWEDEKITGTDGNWERLLSDEDEWIRECAAFARSYGEIKMDAPATLSLMDRILFFKRVPLFENLSPVDLKQAASIAEEELFSDGEEIAHEGDVGDVMFIIVSGEVRVCSIQEGKEIEIARRKAGDYVGEMSIIGREPRMASLVAVGDVRVLCIDQKSFEGLLRERPDVSWSVIQVLNKRLKEASLKK
ncbi:MAG: cyclic nucleotide-binding domain-containing protein [Anaerolineae bacterium]|nr:cyclic nucleotide-binding domain-containing protein [Anaerolineae bacterium]